MPVAFIAANFNHQVDMVMDIHTATPTDDVWQPAAADHHVNNPLTLASTLTALC
jgi:hypothetical protein